MSRHESLQALRRANPRTDLGFDEAIETVRALITTPASEVSAVPAVRSRRRRVAGISLASASLAGATVVAVAGIGVPAGSHGVEAARAAVREAATVTAASAERSGTATVRITHDGELWAAKRIIWNGDDLSLADTASGRDGRSGRELRVVDGVMYAPDEERSGWVRLGSPDPIDPGSGTTPAEYLAAVRDDVGGATLRRLTDGIAGLTARSRDDSTVYRGTAPAGLIARETGVKGGQAIRVLPFGYVAHDEAADPASLLHAAITVDAGGVVREVAVTWGTWRYVVVYSGLGATPAPVAPANAHGLRRQVPPEAVPNG